MQNSNINPSFQKVLLIGDSGVGKTHLLKYFQLKEIPKNCQTTIGLEFIQSQVPLQSGGWVKMQIWDTAGQEKQRSICEHHYRNSSGVFLVQDVTNINSFNNIQRWFDELIKAAGDDMVVFLVGNKCDLKDKRVVSTEAGKTLANDNKMLQIETSAIQGYNINRMFEDMAQNIQNVRMITKDKNININKGNNNKSRNCSC